MIQWGIIGCGDVCEVKSGPAFNKVPNSKLVAVMRRHLQKVIDYATRHGVQKYYTNVDDIINDDEVNAVYIATPPKYHMEYAIKALKAGKPVYIEKPVTLNAAECQQIIDACKQFNGKVSVAHYRRALPLFLKIKDLLTNNEIGDVQNIALTLNQENASYLIALTEDNWRLNPALSGGGYFHDLAPHQLDILYWLFGEPVSFKGSSKISSEAFAVPDFTELNIVFDNGVEAAGTWNFAAETSTENCTIFGTKGSINFSFFKHTILTLQQGDISTTIELPHPAHIQQPMIEKVVNYFMNTGPNPCSLDEAKTVMEMMDSTFNEE
jgi:1,5-anhydro-D-fructose reductase (1,5-anhydro-D-mannitol-forming)